MKSQLSNKIKKKLCSMKSPKNDYIFYNILSQNLLQMKCLSEVITNV